MAGVLEDDWDLIVSAAWPGVAIPASPRAQVYILADAALYGWYFGERVDSESTNYPPRYFLHGNSQFLRRPIARQLVRELYPRAPFWFREGLITFLATARPSADGRSVLVGRPPVTRQFGVHIVEAISLTAILSTEEPDLASEDPALPDLCRLFVRWLFDTQPSPFAGYRAALMRGSDASAAFAENFPGFDVRLAQSALLSYVGAGHFGEFSAPLRKTPSSVGERIMTAAELHVVRARVIAVASDSGEGEDVKRELRDEIDAALAIDPTCVEALELQTWGRRDRRLAGARAAVTAHSSDPQAWRLLGHLLGEQPERTEEEERADRQAMALTPDDPSTLNSLAWFLLRADRPLEALPIAVRAMRAAPNDSAILDTGAEAMFRTGHCAGAVAAQRRAIALLSRIARSRQPQYEQRLERFTAECKPSIPPPALKPVDQEVSSPDAQP